MPKKGRPYWARIAFATFIPSTAADIIPPAYPAPSPQGYIPCTLAIFCSFLFIVTGDELLVSTPVNIASALAKPAIFLSKYINPSFKVLVTKSGKISCKFARVTPGLYVGLTSPIKVDFLLFKKSSTLCIGAL